MTFPRKTGVLLILAAVMATVGHHFGLSLPSLRWIYSFGDVGGREDSAWLVGGTISAIMALVGLVMVVKGGGFHWNPLTLRKAERFRSIGRGHGSYRMLIVVLVVAMLDQVVVGRRALAVKYDGSWRFPAFVQRQYSEADFGGTGEQEADYRVLRERLADEKADAVVILPPVPWDPTFDSDVLMKRPLTVIDGEVTTHSGKEPFNGYAVEYAKDPPDRRVREGRIRDGKLNGPALVFDAEGEILARESWRKGELRSGGVPPGTELPDEVRWVEEIYPPLPPSWERRHFLGTDSKGWDVLAQLYGGLQVVFKASVLYLVLTYGIGITIGCLMGYFGGAFDLVMQRVMEVLSNVPFLLVVMILINNLGRDNVSLGTVIGIFGVFSWIGVAIYLRTSTYKEKARDYTAAARVLGAGTSRVIFRHILPNAISTIVTLVPFSVAAVIASLTALDFLGFGVPDRYPSWGRLLGDGVNNLSSPWIVTSVFVAMVWLLLLITFIGEAVREAFDPKKFTTYQ